MVTLATCSEGPSCGWNGRDRPKLSHRHAERPPLAHVLERVIPLPEARYVVLHCADSFEDNDTQVPYYESIDLQDARHPQTLLAYGLNDQALPIANGAPLRLRVERQLGYKHAKYLMRLELVTDLKRFGGGKGGYWEDQGYQWYAGI